jgi:uncharacterized 2Fe-2S/4Fe-4S cluster protein (DUF4445 family)
MPDDLEGSRIVFPQFRAHADVRRGKAEMRTFHGSILEHARKLGVQVASECGGKGTCGQCVVRVAEGAEALNPPTEAERQFDLGPSERLACQAMVERPGDLRVFVKNIGKYSVLVETIEREIELDPCVQVADGRVLLQAPEAERDLGPYGAGIYGLAVDVGTTTLVAQLVDLETGAVAATSAQRNPQAGYGDDVISRIDHTMRNEDGLAELQQAVVGGVNQQLAEMAREHGVEPHQIYEAVAAGNPTMRDLFFGVEVRTLGVIPFEPKSRDPLNAPADELGLKINPQANVYGPPLIGGHAGADCLADIVTADLHHQDDVSMLIDIGTNGEVAIGNREHMMTCSCAAGGAYEGAQVRSGVGAIEGAIANISLENSVVHYTTIGGAEPVGVCGSGLIDLLAELLKAGIMTKNARLTGDFKVAEGITLAQDDVYALITAKAGLRLDQDLLIKYYGVTLEEVRSIYLAGAFGNYINVDSAVTIGLLPPAPEKVVKIGNGSLAGARLMLLSEPVRREAEQLARTIEHVKPNEREPEFAYMVADKMYF